MHEKFAACVEACNNCADACDHCATAWLQEQDVKMMVRWIGQDITRQASLLAYVDVFLYCAIATALLVPFALLLRPPKPERAKR